jgi:hypothetical protein
MSRLNSHNLGIYLTLSIPLNFCFKSFFKLVFKSFFNKKIDTESPSGRSRGKQLGSKKLTALERLKKARLGEKVIKKNLLKPFEEEFGKSNAVNPYTKMT